MLRLFLMVVLVTLLSPSAQAQDTIIYKGSLVTIGGDVVILYDENSQLTAREAIRSSGYVPSSGLVPNLGVTEGSHWLRFYIFNSSDEDELSLDLAWPILDEVDLYEVGTDGDVFSLLSSGGDSVTRRLFNHQNYIAILNLAPGNTGTYLLRVKSGEQVQLPMQVGSPVEVFESLLKRDMVSAMYFGIVLVMLLYNLFIWFTVKDRSYLYYVGYILLVGLTQAVLQGYAYQYLWPEWEWMEVRSVYLLGAASGIASVLFERSFLNTRRTAPKLDKIFFIFIVAYLITIALTLLGQYNISYKIIDTVALFVSLYMLYVAIVVLRRGYRPARYFLLAWSVFLSSVVIFVLMSFGLVPYNNFTAHILQFGSGIEIILLSFGLADRINILKREKEESQAKAVEALKENERIVLDQNQMLEQQVEVRTKALQTSNQELSEALTNLKQAQAQLVNAEKMASLGQLTAGIAHEINNPINFVASNVKPLRRDIEDVFQVLDGYGELADSTDIKKSLKEMDEMLEEMEITYLRTEIDQLLAGIEEGASRTAEIIRGLKNFSRLDEGDIQTADIHEGLDSTLTLLRSSMMGKIEIERNYGDLPPIECYGGKLNQVFMNILSNSIQAIQENKENGAITIVTYAVEEGVEISIKDDGPGMPEEVQEKIFEPFFTTKDVGKGTGLGLSIVFSIIESHGGTLQVNSKIGEGTEFLIRLPLSPKRKQANE